MGANESSGRREDRDRRIEYERALEARVRQAARDLANKFQQTRDAASKKELEKALEDQKKAYEQKIRSLIKEKHCASASLPSERDAASKRDLENALEMQRILYETKMKALLENQQRGTVATAPLEPLRPTQPAVMQQAAVHVPMQQAAFYQQETAQQAAAQRLIVQQTLTQQGQQSAQQTVEHQVAAHRQAIQAIAAASAEKKRNEGLKLRQTLDYSVSQLYPQLSEINNPRTPSPVSGASGLGTFKDSLQNVQKGIKSNEEDDITCPKCHRRYGERIYNCGQGHSSCHLCKAQGVRCHTCQQQITDIRNYSLEKYVSERRVKCANADDGCRLTIKMSTMAAHVKECPFREMKCPSLGQCQWTGKISNLAGHFDEKHPIHREGNVDKEMFLSTLDTESHTMDLVKIGNFNFLFHVKISAIKQRMSMVAQLVGTKQSAAKWTYEVHIYNKREPRRKFFFTDSCSSNREHLNDIIGTANCAVLPIKYAETFLLGGTIAYKYYIKRDEFKDKERIKEFRGKRRPHSKVGKRN